MRALHAVVALLLVVAPAAAAGPALLGPDRAVASVPGEPWSADSAADAGTATRKLGTQRAVNDSVLNRTTHVLAPPAGEVRRSTVRAHHVDLGPGVSFAANASAARLRTLETLRRIEAAEDDARERRLRAALATIDSRVESLRERERAAIEAYSAGDLSPRAFLIELARIDIAARELQHRKTELVAIAEASSVELDRGRLATLDRRIDVLTGPVRAHAARVLKGTAPSTRFYVSTGPNSVELTTIIEDTYVRESFRGDRYNPGQGRISPETALEIAAESYPVIWESRRNNTRVVGSNGIYLVEIPHARGELRAFVDGRSRSVFREDQRRPLATMDDMPARTATKDGLELRVNRTYAGGPLRIGLVNAETGEPVNANVTLSAGGGESELLGRTGESGTLWTLSPRGQYTVTAIKGNDVVLLRLQSRPPPRVSEAHNGSTN